MMSSRIYTLKQSASEMDLLLCSIGPVRPGLAFAARRQNQPAPAFILHGMSEQLLTSSLHLTEKYFELLSERKIKGYLFQEKNSYPGNTAKSS
jgi:hypothetical protein